MAEDIGRDNDNMICTARRDKDSLYVAVILLAMKK